MYVRTGIQIEREDTSDNPNPCYLKASQNLYNVSEDLEESELLETKSVQELVADDELKPKDKK